MITFKEFQKLHRIGTIDEVNEELGCEWVNPGTICHVYDVPDENSDPWLVFIEEDAKEDLPFYVFWFNEEFSFSTLAEAEWCLYNIVKDESEY